MLILNKENLFTLGSPVFGSYVKIGFPFLSRFGYLLDLVEEFLLLGGHGLLVGVPSSSLLSLVSLDVSELFSLVANFGDADVWISAASLSDFSSTEKWSAALRYSLTDE